MLSALKKASEDSRLAVISHEKWDLQNEVLCQVFGFMLYGRNFAYGRLVCFLDIEDIDLVTTESLENIGLGPSYVRGLVQHARDLFLEKSDMSLNSQLVNEGHSTVATDSSDFANKVIELYSLIAEG
ncbi:TPA: hypothetical protein RQJ98_004468 [Vibrio vulnificus]|uniref:hypothetical protein n=1 Tax=Vibrio vulnificus TaxID=672 RepID=UPI0005F275EF|nr:hypothetical protein [Vibrio vulnificus]MCA3916864.1 hypothetical protein [Vibrio vulnificus]HAS6364174.1 hypothetical protein [Vibrio vulnificus]HDY7544796.1 hypothetical protein [Vibrio vulnificus]HDY7685821.1 hypothetical protein [Vibrio vulnificus]